MTDFQAAIQSIKHAKDVRSATHNLMSALSQYQITHVAPLLDITDLTPVADEHGDDLYDILFGWSAEFIQELNDLGMWPSVSIMNACRSTFSPFSWSTDHINELFTGRKGEKQMRKILRQWQSMGFAAGITIPVHQPMRKIGMILGVTRCKDVDMDNIAVEEAPNLLYLGHCYLDKVMELSARPRNTAHSTDLTEREVECLRWAALGKTDQEIGMIIYRSPTTARFHIDNAAKKLNSVNRTQAVAKASQLGLLGPVC